MSDLVKCRLCDSDGSVDFSASHVARFYVIKCKNTECKNSKTGLRLEEWQSTPIKDHPLKNEIMELIKSGKVTIS